MPGASYQVVVLVARGGHLRQLTRAFRWAPDAQSELWLVWFLKAQALLHRSQAPGSGRRRVHRPRTGFGGGRGCAWCGGADWVGVFSLRLLLEKGRTPVWL